MSEDIEVLLSRTNELLAILVKTQLRSLVAEELSDSKKRKLYDLTDGKLPVKELARKLNMSTGSISQTWQKWDEMGLLVKRNGKYRRTFE